MRALKVGARTLVSKGGRAGDDVDVRGAVFRLLRTVLASILHALLGSETVARPRGSTSVEQRLIVIDADDAEDAPDDDEKRIDCAYWQRE